MLYTSTRNLKDTFTAYRALNEEAAPDGGMYVPYRMPVLSAEDLAALKKQSVFEAVADVLNLFFSARITDAEVESFTDKFAFSFRKIPQNVIFVELWHTADGSGDYLVKNLYQMLTEKRELPKGWAYIAIKIALLFGIYVEIHKMHREFDIAIPADDFADLTAVLYAKDMGLPINRIVCSCGENGVVWDLVNKGEFGINQAPLYLECFLHKYVGDEGVNAYLDACAQKRTYQLDETIAEQISGVLYAAVVSSGRIDTVVSSMYRANGYAIDCDTAFAYGGLQDYQASTGANKQTLIISAKRPERIKE